VAREKLIRHRIPWLAEAKGETMRTRISADNERDALLKDKLLEEVAEFLGNPSIDELIDVEEVVRALRERLGPEEFDRAAADKYRECGGLYQGVVLILED